MSIKCLVDNSEHESIEEMHAYLRKFKIKRADYYTHYFPRKDIFTGEPIPFKDVEQYFNQEFLNKINLKQYLKEGGEEAKRWAINWLLERAKKKNLIFAPSQAELRTLMSPSMVYYNKIGGYYNITKEIGFIDRYKDEEPIFAELPQNIEIIQDTREQNELKFPYRTVETKLECGDYGLSFPYDKNIYIERKSLNDFCGTMSKGFERFEKEIERAKDRGYYLVMVVECNMTKAMSFDYLEHMKHVRAQPSHVFKRMRDLLVKYPLNFQIVFVDGRIDAVKKIIKIFQLGEQVKRLDLQYLVDTKKL